MSDADAKVKVCDSREGVCEDCRSAYATWFAANDLWNAVMRPPGYEDEPFLCPRCFTLRARSIFENAIFKLCIEDDTDLKLAETTYESLRLKRRVEEISEAADGMLYAIHHWRTGGITAEGCRQAEDRLRVALSPQEKPERNG